MVVISGGVLHHLELLEVRAVLKGSCFNGEIKRQQSVVVVGIGVLEVERLECLAVTESMRGYETQMGVVAPVAHKVIVYLYAIAVVVTLAVACNDGYLRCFTVAVLDNKVGIGI